MPTRRRYRADTLAKIAVSIAELMSVPPDVRNLAIHGHCYMYGGGAREGESVVIVNVTLLSIICGGASCRGQDLSGWCPAAVGMCSTPMGGPPQLWMTKLRVSCGFYELVVTPPTEKR